MILVVAEHKNGIAAGETYETASFAKELGSFMGDEPCVLFMGKDTSAVARSFSHETGLDCLTVNSDALNNYSLEGYTAALSIIAERFKPSFICIPNTSTGIDYAPYLSIKLDAACFTGIESIEEFPGGIAFSRTAWHGKVKVYMKPERDITVATIFPGSFKWEGQNADVKGSVNDVDVSIELEKTLFVSLTESEIKKTSLKDADVIVGAGNGTGKDENMLLMEGLASCFSRSAVAGSRIACDKGWVDYGLQLGMTGQIVSPKLYIACGISGSLQHVMGIKGSDFIVAINRDRGAPIFQHADTAVVENLEEFIPVFVEVVKGRKN